MRHRVLSSIRARHRRPSQCISSTRPLHIFLPFGDRSPRKMAVSKHLSADSNKSCWVVGHYHVCVGYRGMPLPSACSLVEGRRHPLCTTKIITIRLVTVIKSRVYCATPCRAIQMSPFRCTAKTLLPRQPQAI